MATTLGPDKTRLATYIDKDLKVRLERVAKSQRRSMSNLIEILCEEACNNFEAREKANQSEE